MNTFLRRIEILHYLQQRHASRLGPVGTDQIIQHLIDGEYLDEDDIESKSTIRLVQRDLKFLLGEIDYEQDSDDGEEYTNTFGLKVIRGQGKTLLWSLDPYQQVSYDFEKMPAYMALALTVTRKHLKQVLPSSTQQELAQVFYNAETKLQRAESKLSAKQYTRLGNAVEFYQRGQSLRSPDFDMSVLDRIYQAILLGKRLRFTYAAANGTKSYDVHPFGVTIMLPKLYLVAVKDDDMKSALNIDGDDSNDFRSFLVHRISELEILPLSNSVPEDFALKDYLDSGSMDVLLDRNEGEHLLKVELYTKANSNLLRDLQDSPLNDSQCLEELGEGVWCLTATVKRTVQLRNWLLALGAQAKVIESKQIQHDLINYLDAMQQHYS